MKLADLKGIPPPRLLSRKQAAIVLNCSQESLNRYEREGFMARVPDVPRPVYEFAAVAQFAAMLRLHYAAAIDRPDLMFDTG